MSRHFVQETITHVTTATAILNIDGVNFLTDPFFGAIEGTEYDLQW
jgi:L-ascorbate metabolism protein UlaG (beta-lactamase superfamily)